MSATGPDLDLREQIARIDRAQAETRKLFAEREKLLAEAAKLNRDRAWVPIVAIAAAIAAGIALLKSAGLL